LFHNILPTHDKISSIRNGVDDICKRCGKERETLIHVMKDCPKARAVLEFFRLSNKFLGGDYSRCIDWIEDIARQLTWERVAALSRDFRIFSLVEDPLLLRKTVTKAWQKPHQGVLKINFEASVQGKKVFYGLVAKDADGFVHGGRIGFVDKELPIEWTELLAMEESLNFSRLNNWKNLALELDCASLVNRFNKRNNDLTLLGCRLREIHRQSFYFRFFNFRWAPQCCNEVADFICNWAKVNNCNMDFNMDYLSEIHEIVLNDAIN
ncbi:hypothetical protein Goarm_022539, partial [Gossypium armourianum]|nr:hypothetical protein [Gossypium armourianum]